MEPTPPQQYLDFVERFPELAKGWELLGKGARERGPLDAHTVALIKLAIAIGARLEGPVHSAARKGLAAGLTQDEMDQVVALSASTVGFPTSVAAFTWIRDVVPGA